MPMGRQIFPFTGVVTKRIWIKSNETIVQFNLDLLHNWRSLAIYFVQIDTNPVTYSNNKKYYGCATVNWAGVKHIVSFVMCCLYQRFLQMD